MGMTLWIHTLDGRNYSKESDDHTMMHRLSHELDDICSKAGVAKLSYFFDFTDLNFNYGDEFSDEFDEDEIEDDMSIDPETGLGYGIDDMTWFDASDGSKTIGTLLSEVRAGMLSSLGDEELMYLCEELEDCLKQINGIKDKGGKFHLAVIE